MQVLVKWLVFFGLIISSTLQARQDRKNLNIESATYQNDTAYISELILSAKNLRHKATDSGIQLFHKAIVESRRINYNDGLARGITGLGLFYMDKGEYNKSFAYYQLALPFCKASDFQGGVLLVGLYNNIAALTRQPCSTISHLKKWSAAR